MMIPDHNRAKSDNSSYAQRLSMSQRRDNSLVALTRLNRSHSTVSIGFVKGMLSGLLARGGDPRELLCSVGLSLEILTEANSRLPLADYARLYNTVVRSIGDEGFGIFSAPIPIGSFEFLCRSIVSSRTLNEALDRASRFLRLVLRDLNVTVSRGCSSAQLQIAETHPLRPNADDPCRIFAFEWLLRLLHGLSCWLVGRDLALDKVSFPYSKPAHAADYGLIYTKQSIFNSRVLSASLSAHLLDLPIRRDENALSIFLEGAPGKITMLYRRDRDTVRRVRNMILATLPQTISQEEIAAHLHISPRTLHRRLSDEGATFRTVKDAVRRDIALSQLVTTKHSIARIAADLGYSEVSAFFRAFQGWTGLAPTKYRKHLVWVSTTYSNH